MIKFLRGLLITLSIIFLMSAAFLGGYWYHNQELDSPASFPLLEEAYSLLIERGLKDPPPAPVLEYGMIRGMLQAYNDPYTVFVEPPAHELQTNELEGKFGGIGVQIKKDIQGNWVLFPIPDGPASKAGIQDGDRLITIGDYQVVSETTAEIIEAAIRGQVGQPLSLTVGRAPDYQAIQFSVIREEIAIPSVTWYIDPAEHRAGIVKVNLMAASTAGEIMKAVKDLQKRGASVFVLDLRDNPGGYLTAGIDVARLFLKDGVVLEQQYRGREVESYPVEQRGSLAEIPLAVLINTGSASASEIVAGAIQAYERAPLIGNHTYGKDTIQLVFELSDKSSLHITAARWWVPELDTPIGGAGLQPDIPVEPATDASGADLVLQAALKYFFGK